MTGLQAWADGVWTIGGDRIRMLGIPFELRMTVVRLAGGGLWLHSVVQPDDERVRAVQELGTVAHIVAPNPLHHLFVAPWRERFPDARTWACPGLTDRRPELSFDETLSDEPPAAWRDDFDQVIFGGSKWLTEVVFLHRASRTILFTDIVQNHEPDADGWFWRTVKRMAGIVAPNGGTPRDWRLTVRDRDAARRARDQLLAWDFDRMIITHGRCVPEDAHAFVERAFSWLG